MGNEKTAGQQMIEEISTVAQAYAAELFEKHNEVPTTFMVLKPDGELLIAVAPWGDDLERARVLFSIRLLIMMTEATAYAHVGEAWTVTRHQKEMRARIQPKDCEDREEILCVSVVTRTGEKSHQTWALLRDENSVRIGAERKMDEGVEVGGAMFDLFNFRIDGPNGGEDGWVKTH